MITYSPHDGQVLTDRIKYQPKSCFIMTQLGGSIPNNLKEIRKAISHELRERKIKEIDAYTQITGRDFLLKIWRQILSVPMGVAIITNQMDSSTVANIFYEIGLLDSLGKETIIVKAKDREIPSDFIRTEYIAYGKSFTDKFNKYIDTIFEQAEHYETMSNLMGANPVLSIDYLRRAYLITGNKSLIKKAQKIFKKNEFDDQSKFTIRNFLES